jgi:hypothetical protein
VKLGQSCQDVKGGQLSGGKRGSGELIVPRCGEKQWGHGIYVDHLAWPLVDGALLVVVKSW